MTATAFSSSSSAARRLHKCLQAALPGTPLPADPTGLTGVTYLWLTLSLLFATMCGALGLARAFAGPYVVQDDARTFLFWMERFVDPELFRHDLIADYFSAVSPPGYTALNWIAAVLFGIDPFVLNKLLPIVLALIMTTYAFLCCMELFPVPAAAFAVATILNESVWLADALPSGTPRAFIYPIFLAFLYYLLRSRAVALLASVALLGLFYPQMLTIAVGTLALSLIRWEQGRPRLSRERRAYVIVALAIIVTLPLVGWAALLASHFGPVVTAAQAHQMMEFGPGGRTNFYTLNAWRFWISGERSGVLPFGIKPPLIWLSLCLPAIVAFRSRLVPARLVSRQAGVLTRIVLASFCMFALAHLFLFNFHLPSRYTQHSLRMVMALAAGISLAIIVDIGLRALGRVPLPRHHIRGFAQAALGLVMVGTIVLYPLVFWFSGGEFPYVQYVAGRDTDLYAFLRSQPKDIVVASLSTQVDLIPTFAQRTILTGYEYGIPYHLGYFGELQRRSHALLAAEYSPDSAVLHEFVDRYNVTYFLLNRTAYTPEYVSTSRWIQELQPEARAAFDVLSAPEVPALAKGAERCTVFLNARFALVDARCAVDASRT